MQYGSPVLEKQVHGLGGPAQPDQQLDSPPRGPGPALNALLRAQLVGQDPEQVLLPVVQLVAGGPDQRGVLVVGAEVLGPEDQGHSLLELALGDVDLDTEGHGERIIQK